MKLFYVFINIAFIYGLLSIQYKRNKEEEPGYAVLVSLVGAFLLNMFTALTLVVLQIYSFKALMSLLFILLIAFTGYLIHKGKWTNIRVLKHWFFDYKYHIIPILLILIAATLYLGFPSKYMLGGRDPGLYLLNGIHISETGAMQYDSDPYLNAHYEEVKDVLYPGYPGLFTPEKLEGFEGNPGVISPQFLPMFPSVLAIGYDLAGIEGIVRVNGLVGILSLLVLYYVAKRLFSKKTAVAALLIMILEPAQLWGSRITETEILSQMLFFLSMYFFTMGWKWDKKSYFNAAGFFLGIGCMNRIDTYIYGVGLIAGMLYCILWKKKYCRQMALAYWIYGVLGGLSLLYGWKFSHIYIVEHWQAGVLAKIVLLNVVGFLALFIIWGILKLLKISLPNWVLILIRNKKTLFIAFLILILTFVYAYVVRPFGSESFTKRAMIEFCWYTSVPMVLFAMYGLYRMFWDKQEQSEMYFVFFLTALASIFVYIISPSVGQDHIWAGRRWITVNVPFVIVLGCYGIMELQFGTKYLRNLVQGGLVLGVTGFMLYQSKPFLFTHIMEDLDKQYEELAEDLDNDIVYFTTNQQIASYLKYIYGKQVYLMSEEKTDNYVEFLKEQGSIHYIGSESGLGPARFSYQYNAVPRRHMLSGKYLEKAIGYFPRKLYDRKLPATIYELVYGSNLEIVLGEEEIQTANAVYDNEGNICADGNAGIVFYGPYITLEAGTYEFSFDISGNVLNATETKLEISYDTGNQLVLAQQVTGDGNIIIPFTLEQEASGIETRLWAGAGSEIICKDMRIRKIE